MSKVTKKKLQADHNKLLNQFAELVRDLKSSKVISEETCPTFYRRAAEFADDTFEQAEPKLKHLDQSVFDGLDEEWRFAAICGSGKAIAAKDRPETLTFGYFIEDGFLLIDTGYDTTNWQNSLIERDKVELTGSDLTEQIIRNQKYQAAFVSDESEQDALNSQRTALIDCVYMSDRDYRFRAELKGYRYAIPINNKGEPLTAADAGL